jgi:hypothetical protein
VDRPPLGFLKIVLSAQKTFLKGRILAIESCEVTALTTDDILLKSYDM